MPPFPELARVCGKIRHVEVYHDIKPHACSQPPGYGRISSKIAEYLKGKGRQVEVIAFRETASSKLVETADIFTDLSQNKRRYLITGGRPTLGRPKPGTRKKRLSR